MVVQDRYESIYTTPTDIMTRGKHMAASQWIIDKQLIYLQLPTEVDTHELLFEIQNMAALLSEGDPPVTVVIYADENVRLPTTISDLRNSMSWSDHPHLGSVIVYGDNRLFSFMGSVLANLAGMHITFADNLLDVLDVLRELDLDVDAINSHMLLQ